MLHRKAPPPPPLPSVALAAPWLWGVAVLDMVAVAWMIAAGEWLDHASQVTTVMTLGGHHGLVLVMASAGFVMLAGLAALTRGFTSASRVHVALVSVACAISVAALAGALSVILLVLIAAVVLGLAGRPLFWR